MQTITKAAIAINREAAPFTQRFASASASVSGYLQQEVKGEIPKEHSVLPLKRFRSNIQLAPTFYLSVTCATIT
jgi:hypothetical protein